MNIFVYDKLWGPSQRVVTLFDGTGRLDGKELPFFTPGSTMSGADAGESYYQRNIAEQRASAGAPQILAY